MATQNQKPHYNILVLEDDNETRDIVRDVLSALGVAAEDTTWVRTAVEALRARGPIDLFVADLEVYQGKLDGPKDPEKEAGLAAIRGLTPGRVDPSKIIVVSKYKHYTDMRRALMEANIDMAKNAFEKPADPPTLKTAIARVLGI